MTKKERAAIDATIKELRIRAALCWSDDVRPDIKPPEHSNEMTTGWLPVHWGGTTLACSSSAFHGTGRIDRTTSQGPRWLYSTRLLALRARRYEIAKRAAEELADIDSLIADEFASAHPASKE